MNVYDNYFTYQITLVLLLSTCKKNHANWLESEKDKILNDPLIITAAWSFDAHKNVAVRNGILT